MWKAWEWKTWQDHIEGLYKVLQGKPDADLLAHTVFQEWPHLTQLCVSEVWQSTDLV